MMSCRGGVSLVAVLLLAACGGDSGDGPGASGGKTPARPKPSSVVKPGSSDALRIQFGGAAPSGLTSGQVEKLIASQRLPIAPTHGGGFETMTNSIRLGPAPDVMLVGDSMTQQGVDPRALAAALRKRSGRNLRVFNGASSRARWGVNRLTLRYSARLNKTPKVVLIGISTRAAERDEFYAGAASRAPFSSVVEGCVRQSAWTPEDQARCERERTDLVYRWRSGGGQLRYAQTHRRIQTSLRAGNDTFLRSDGFMMHPGVVKAKAQAISDDRMKRGFPGYPMVHEDSVGEFRQMVQELREHGATVLAFEIPYSPVHQKNLEEAGRNYDKRRQQAARRLAESATVPLFSVSSFGSWWSDGDSRDAIHLAPKGGAKYARQLTEISGFSDAVLAGLKTGS
jgi:hypothetical protein